MGKCKVNRRGIHLRKRQQTAAQGISTAPWAQRGALYSPTTLQRNIIFGGRAGVSGQDLATPNDVYDNTTNIIDGDQAGRSCKLRNLSWMEPLPMSGYTTSVSHTHTSSYTTSDNHVWKPCLTALLKGEPWDVVKMRTNPQQGRVRLKYRVIHRKA
jgi:hypothetical protein